MVKVKSSKTTDGFEVKIFVRRIKTSNYGDLPIFGIWHKNNPLRLISPTFKF